MPTPRQPVYSVWSAMVQRCTNPKNINYHRYGGRGIDVCKKWLKFKGFLEDMGYPPSEMTLERVDNDRGYSKENCVWAPMVVQAANRRNNVIVELDGEPLIFADACTQLGVNYQLILYYRRTRGVSHQEALAIWQQLQKKK